MHLYKINIFTFRISDVQIFYFFSAVRSNFMYVHHIGSEGHGSCLDIMILSDFDEFMHKFLILPLLLRLIGKGSICVIVIIIISLS